jgi:hypothetical protein
MVILSINYINNIYLEYRYIGNIFLKFKLNFKNIFKTGILNVKFKSKIMKKLYICKKNIFFKKIFQ